jgi:hypothetical protein
MGEIVAIGMLSIVVNLKKIPSQGKDRSNVQTLLSESVFALDQK